MYQRGGRKAVRIYRALYYGPLRCRRGFRISKCLPPWKIRNVYILESPRLIYYEIPKTGCTTIKTILLEMENSQVPDGDEAVHVKLFPRAKYPSDVQKPEFDDYFRFALVRNPWARLVSCYQNKVLNPRPGIFFGIYPRIPFNRMSFTDFVRFVCRVPDDLCEPHFRPQSDFLASGNINFIGRFENFSDDLTRVLKAVGCSDKGVHKWLTIRRMQTLGERLHYPDFYNTETQRLVEKKFKRDIEQFNYRFGD